MTTKARSRLIKDIKNLKKEPPEGMIIQPIDTDVLTWDALLFGPEDTPWEGGVFRLSIQFTEEYPNKPPEVRFQSKIYHPNVYQNGKICLDILDKQWSQLYNAHVILRSIRMLLTEPNPDSPANPEAAKLFVDDKKAYSEKIRNLVEDTWLYKQ